MADQHVPKDDRGFLAYGWDYDEDVFKVALLVYNPATLDWERMKQPILELTGDLTVTMGDVESLLAKSYYKRTKPYIYASGRVKYLCKNTDIDAAEADTDWLCWKYTDADIPEIEGPRTSAAGVALVGDVDGLAWNI